MMQWQGYEGLHMTQHYTMLREEQQAAVTVGWWRPHDVRVIKNKPTCIGA
jgi:hypothetical protein